MRTLLATCLALAACIGTGASAQVSAAEPLYDPTQLPIFHGTVQLFTLTPRGDIDGFVLQDGTEVKTPPHLTSDLAAAVRPGDKVTIHGLKAASLALIQAMSVSNDATGAAVIDAGPTPGRTPPATPRREGDAPTEHDGSIRMVLHGPRGEINGVLLEDGTVLKLPPPEAARFTDVLARGRRITAAGIRYTMPSGSFVDLTALGPEGGPLRPIAGVPRPGPTPADMSADRLTPATSLSAPGARLQ
jgi:hypothetical protein